MKPEFLALLYSYKKKWKTYLKWAHFHYLLASHKEQSRSRIRNQSGIQTREGIQVPIVLPSSMAPPASHVPSCLCFVPPQLVLSVSVVELRIPSSNPTLLRNPLLWMLFDDWENGQVRRSTFFPFWFFQVPLCLPIFPMNPLLVLKAKKITKFN